MSEQKPDLATSAFKFGCGLLLLPVGIVLLCITLFFAWTFISMVFSG